MKNVFKSFAEMLGAGAKVVIEENAEIEQANEVVNQIAEQVADEKIEQTETEQVASTESPNEPAAEIATLAEGMVAVNAAELETLKANAAKWEANATEFANLKAWKKSADESTELVDNGGADADQATAEKPKPKSYLQQIADQRSRVGKR